MIFPHTQAGKWNDYAKMNSFLSRAIFPSMSYEYQNDFLDRADTARSFLFDRVVFADRAAAFRGTEFQRTWRTASEAVTLQASRYWWAPLRKNLLEFVGAGNGELAFEDEVVGVAVEQGLSPDELDVLALEEIEDAEAEVKELMEQDRQHKAAHSGKPVVTYISRQDWGRRMLKKESHESLVKELLELENKYGWEVSFESRRSFLSNPLILSGQHRLDGQALPGRADPTGGTNDNNDGRARQWPHSFTLDEQPEPSRYSHRVLLSRRFRRGLRVHCPIPGDSALWRLGRYGVYGAGHAADCLS
jgi:hypothetical protein